MNKVLAVLCSLALGCASVGAWAQVNDNGGTAPPATDTGAAPPTDDTATPGQEPAPADDPTVIDNVASVLATNLSGAEEVPPRDTNATGSILLQLSEDGSSIQYRLSVQGLDNVVAAHLHLGRPGENGPIVVTLYGPENPGGGAANGVLAEGTITDANLEGPLAGTPLAVLVELLRGGSIYVNVHTNDGEDPPDTGPGDFPAGEIRGQVDVLAASVEACQLISGQAEETPAAPAE